MLCDLGLVGDASTSVSSRAREATDDWRECAPRLPLTLAVFFTDASFGDGPGRLAGGGVEWS